VQNNQTLETGRKSSLNQPRVNKPTTFLTRGWFKLHATAVAQNICDVSLSSSLFLTRPCFDRPLPPRLAAARTHCESLPNRRVWLQFPPGVASAGVQSRGSSHVALVRIINGHSASGGVSHLNIKEPIRFHLNNYLKNPNDEQAENRIHSHLVNNILSVLKKEENLIEKTHIVSDTFNQAKYSRLANAS
jgi:hypothetical protein